MYALNNACSNFDRNGLDTQAASMSIGFNIPVYGFVGTSSWNGTFVWSFVQKSESSSITPTPPNSGLTGFTGLGLTVSIAGVTVGLGVQDNVVYSVNSSYETKMESGKQWKRYIVDMKADYTSSLVVGVSVYTTKYTSTDIHKEGNWYE